jgi:CRISPR system Cascade subunit CasD
MTRFLILRLDGPMQAWGTHTFEDYRPTNLYPTRSGLLGLIGACLGIERGDSDALTRLSQSVQLTVRVDRTAPRPQEGTDQESEPPPKAAIRLADFHTVLDARKVGGSASKFPVVSRREYLYDAAFTVAVGERPGAQFGLDRITAALRCPRYTPVLGRRSCPITRPLLEKSSPVDADDALQALAIISPIGGTIYAESDLVSEHPIQMRDVPSYGRHRQFGTRRVYVHKEDPT